MDTLAPAPPVRTLVYRPEDFFQRMDTGVLFPRLQPLEVELGAGDGSFLLQWAAGHPERNFIGVERLVGRLRKIDRKGLRAGLANLRAMRIEARYLVEWMLPAGAVSVLHIYFPDPWPKRKHRRHRLINEQFPEVAARALAPEGRVCLRTDDADYFSQMQAVFAASPLFAPVDPEPGLLEVRTDFETEFNAKGIPTRHAVYQKLPLLTHQ